MSLPIATAIVSVGIGLSLIGLLGHLTDVSPVAPTLGTMIGLGVGIDYSLFIVKRYRERLADGYEPSEAIARSVATSGSAVVFAGSTVVIALLSLILARIPVVTSLGFSAALRRPGRGLRGGHLPAGHARRDRAWDRLGARSRSAVRRPTTSDRTAGPAGPRVSANHPWPAMIAAVAHPRCAFAAVVRSQARPGGRRPVARGHDGPPGLRRDAPRASGTGPTDRSWSRSSSTRPPTTTRRSSTSSTTRSAAQQQQAQQQVNAQATQIANQLIAEGVPPDQAQQQAEQEAEAQAPQQSQSQQEQTQQQKKFLKSTASRPAPGQAGEARSRRRTESTTSRRRR